ncbi:LutC/YkgG family protein [Aestuariimicrobium ganziense]|uniref:LutC/YkgG family protein n=1 Tax=Aestuariimicrobium ganziense TaxID=2773677 RepID=UPI0019455C10|nr:lactate utilization protein C [Aestuariimicrobium ganziense]
MSARDEILGRIRGALADVGEPDPARDVVLDWNYGQPLPMDDVIARFVQRVEDYRAEVVRADEAALPGQITAVLQRHGATAVVVPAGLPEAWRDAAGAAADVVVEQRRQPLPHDELNRIDAVVTASRVSIAETGTIVLDHAPDQGRRALSLVPDLHLCVVREGDVVSDVGEAVGLLGISVASHRPLTWISGPSATSDIELNRVEGVHGPRTLVVLLVG